MRMSYRIARALRPNAAAVAPNSDTPAGKDSAIKVTCIVAPSRAAVEQIWPQVTVGFVCVITLRIIPPSVAVIIPIMIATFHGMPAANATWLPLH